MRILVLSDIHSNLTALEAVLSQAGPCDAVWCLGDVVGYGPDPNACIERLAELDAVAVAGNHDWAVLGKLDLAEFNGDARRANLWTREQLTPVARAYLDALPEMRTEAGCTLVHGSPRAPVWEYLIYPSIAKASFAHFGTSLCLVGHTHVPVIFTDVPDSGYCEAAQPAADAPVSLAEGRHILNPGSVGQPRDGDPRAAYAIYDSEAHKLTWARAGYAIAETQTRMRAAGLPRHLIQRLDIGS